MNVEVKGSNGAFWKVSYTNGKWRCSCPDWRYRGAKWGTPCKHIIQEQAKGIVEEKKRIPREQADEVIAKVVFIRELSDRCEVCGSYRRGRADVGDLDFLVVCDDYKWSLIYQRMGKEGKEVCGGMKKMSFWVDEVQVDVNRAKPEEWGAALCHHTGSTAENIRLREVAVTKGWKLSQHGFETPTGLIPVASEQEVYEALGLSYREPKDRDGKEEGQGVVVRAA